MCHCIVRRSGTVRVRLGCIINLQVGGPAMAKPGGQPLPPPQCRRGAPWALTCGLHGLTTPLACLWLWRWAGGLQVAHHLEELLQEREQKGRRMAELRVQVRAVRGGAVSTACRAEVGWVGGWRVGQLCVYTCVHGHKLQYAEVLVSTVWVVWVGVGWGRRISIGWWRWQGLSLACRSGMHKAVPQPWHQLAFAVCPHVLPPAQPRPHRRPTPPCTVLQVEEADQQLQRLVAAKANALADARAAEEAANEALASGQSKFAALQVPRMGSWRQRRAGRTSLRRRVPWGCCCRVATTQGEDPSALAW